MANSPCPVQNKLVRSEGRSDSFQPSCFLTSQDPLEKGQKDPVLPLVGQLWSVLNTEDEATPFDPGFARLHRQRHHQFEIWSEDGAEFRGAPNPLKKPAAQFTGNPLRNGQVVGPRISTGVADDNVLVIGKRPNVGFLC